MRRRILRTIISIGLMFAMISINFFEVGRGLSIAIYENLENQEYRISDTNIEFNAYFKENGNNKHSKTMSILNGDNLYINLNIRDTGSLNNAVIVINNPNFTIAKDKINNKYVKSVEDNKIYLNQVIYGNQVELDIPIKFEKNDKIASDYFDRQTSITLEGEYQYDEQDVKHVKGEIKVAGIWSENVETNFSQDIEKYFVMDNGKTLLQQRIDVEVVNNILPIKNEKITIKVPDKDNGMKIVAVLNNGKKLNENSYSYDENNGEIIITKNIELEGNNIIWGTGKDEYKIIYNYDNSIENNKVNLDTKLELGVYTKELIQKQDTKEVELKELGEIITLQKQMTESNYKGYLYANVGNETTYQEKLDIEISDIDNISNIEVETGKNSFITNDNKELSTNNSTYYKNIKFNKNQISEILGQESNISIIDYGNNTISTIDRNSQEDEAGNINVQINNIENIKIILSKPVTQGNIQIILEKAIKSDTGYEKETLKNVAKLKNETLLKLKDYIATNSYMNLLDTVSEAKLEVNNTNFSTLQKNENIQIVATLKSDSNKYDLYKNPYVEIKLPDEVENIEVKSIQKMYADEMDVEKVQYNKAEKKIEMQLRGEQKEFKNSVNQGIQIIISANITLNKLTPTKNSVITLKYTNENRNNEENTVNADIKMNSKYGVLMYGMMNGYNEQSEQIEALSQKAVTGKIDTNAQRKEANVTTAVINNYEADINNVIIVGKIDTTNESDEFKSTIQTKLLGQIQTNYPDAKVLYATENISIDSEQWYENVEDLSQVKMFKISIPTLRPSEVINVSYKIEIPENVQNDETYFQITRLQYEYNNQEFEDYTTLKLIGDGENSQISPLSIEENVEGIDLKITTISGGKELQDGEEIFEGQTVKHIITLTNNTGKDLTNFSVVGKQQDADGNNNVTFFNMKKEQVPDAVTGNPVIVTNYEEDETLTEKGFKKDVLTNGETVEFEYEFTINKAKNENEVTIGKLEMKADDFELSKDIMQNKIKDAELKLTTKYSKNEEVIFSAGSENSFTYNITNISENTLENITLNLSLTDGVTLRDEYRVNGDNYTYEEFTDNNIKINIKKLDPEETLTLVLDLYVEPIGNGETEKTYDFSCNATINGNQYYSNVISKSDVNRIANFEIVQTASIEEESVKEGDEIQFVANIRNTSNIEADLLIEDNVSSILNVTEAYLMKDGERIADAQYEKDSDTGEGYLSANYLLGAYSEIDLVINAVVGENLYDLEQFENVISAMGGDYYTESNVITYKLQDGINENPSNPSQRLKALSGIAWIDSNKNGIRDDSSVMSGMTVLLFDGATGQLATDENGATIQTTTDQNGFYKFDNLTGNSYMVGFEYDTNKYTVTQYQVQNTDASTNSDVISKVVNINGQDKEIAITNEITISNLEIRNIDAGFYEKNIFDLSLKKTINRITVQNSKSKTVTEYNDATLAKVELKAKELAGTVVTIEYDLKITNEGEIPGQVNEIVDYIPNDLQFDEKSNPDWYLTREGELHNSSLTNTTINPGETQTIKLVLTKTMNENNLGNSINKAEIAKASNDLNIADIDSTYGNNVETEDDMGKAEVIISISTGKVVLAISLSLIVILMIVGGIIYIKRRKEV